MKKIRKGKKMLIIGGIAVVAIVLAIVIISNIIKNGPGSSETPDDVRQVIQLPETTYSDMQVKNIEMEFLKDNDETMVSMEIHNTTDKTVENENLDAVLVGEDENTLGQILTYIQKLQPGEQYDISVILKGDLTATKQIKLIKK